MFPRLALPLSDVPVPVSYLRIRLMRTCLCLQFHVLVFITKTVSFAGCRDLGLLEPSSLQRVGGKAKSLLTVKEGEVMSLVVSEKLSKLLEVWQSVQALALEQLVEDFVLHLEEEYQRVILRGEITKEVTITQWLGSLGDYGVLVDRYWNSTSLFNETRTLVDSVASFSVFAEALEKSLNDKHPSNDAGYLLVRALREEDENEREVIVTFRYDPLYGWGE